MIIINLSKMMIIIIILIYDSNNDNNIERDNNNTDNIDFVQYFQQRYCNSGACRGCQIHVRYICVYI